MEVGMNILLIAALCARRDKFPSYGYPIQTAPYLTKFAEECWQAPGVPQSRWTLPSCASLFTGLYPSEHGLLRGSADPFPRLAPDIQTLAERLRQQGYTTGGHSNCLWISATTGLHRGFNSFIEHTWKQSGDESTSLSSAHFISIPQEFKKALRSVADKFGSGVHKKHIYNMISNTIALKSNEAQERLRVIKWPFYARRRRKLAMRWIIDQYNQERPFFAFVNVGHLHFPYYPPHRDRKAVQTGHLPSMRAWHFNRLLQTQYSRIDDDKVFNALYNHYYDASLHFLDRELEHLLEPLRAKGILEHTLVIIIGLHGEQDFLLELQEPDKLGSPLVRMGESVMSVPFWVRYPEKAIGLQASQIPKTRTGYLRTPLELIVIHDTILQWAGIKYSKNTKRPLLSLREAISTPPPFAYAEAILPTWTAANLLDHVHIIRTAEYKYVVLPHKTELLFDLVTDKDEQHNIALTRPVILDYMRAHLQSRLAALELAQPPIYDTDSDRNATMEHLKALLQDAGYRLA
jgi:arylsulfatase A-like enzyme